MDPGEVGSNDSGYTELRALYRLFKALEAGSQVNVLRRAGRPVRSELSHGPVN